MYECYYRLLLFVVILLLLHVILRISLITLLVTSLVMIGLQQECATLEGELQSREEELVARQVLNT